MPKAQGIDMYQSCKQLTALAAVLILSSSSVGTAASKTNSEATQIKGEGPAVLWRNPVDIASRNLYYGPGGKEHAPHGTFTFEREDLRGTTPKFEVIDQDGVKWKVKMGDEARPETAATRLLWAVGYFANEDYFVPVLHVQNIQRLHRVGGHVSRDGSVHNVRMKRHQKQEKNIGAWSWADNPFTGTRELYGLRVMMAVINNWDLKDENNAVYQVRGDSPEQRYIVRDLGSSFGTTGFNVGAKGNLKAYRNSNWISAISPEFIDFNVPSRPAFVRFLNVPETVQRMHLCWIGRHIPSSDAAWIGNLLAKLSPDQIRDAFRGAGYSPREVEVVSLVVERRIRELQGLNKMVSKRSF